MPPKRSARLSASASKPPAAKKQKRGRKSSATVSREEVATPSTANVTLPAIPPDLVEQIVNRVADEVSRRMASGTGGLPSNTNALKEVPVIDMTAAGSAANGISPLVQGSINAVQKNLTGTDFQTVGSTSHGPIPHRDTPVSAASELAAIVSTLMKSSLQPSSLPTYKRAWRLYNQFLCGLHEVYSHIMLRPNLYIYLFVYESPGPVTWSSVSHLGCKSALIRVCLFW